MKLNDIVVGGKYLCYIGEVLSEVIVVRIVEGRKDAFFSSDRRTRIEVMRPGAYEPLPKLRSPAALRNVNKNLLPL